MRVFFIFFLTISFISCIDDNPDSLKPLPQAVLLDFSVINERLDPVTVSIRHKYFWHFSLEERESIIAYSDWSTEYLNSGESKPVGVEKTKIHDGSAYQEIEGFILLDRAFGSLSSPARLISSFELRIETADDTLFIPKYILTGDETDENDLCRLIVINSLSLREISCRLLTYKQDLYLFDWADDWLIVPARLIIKFDGTVSFEHETIGNK